MPNKIILKNNNHLMVAALLIAGSSLVVNCQFLPQSHLGRLVQSITSPLVLSSGGGYGEDSDSDSGSYPYSGENAGGEQPAASRPDSAGTGSDVYNQGRNTQSPTSLQQEPSQQRGVPTQHNYYSGHDDERDQGSAPSNNKHTQDYQMGAYLGPTMDDKELNGVFNSNDDRDDDDGPAGYDGPSEGGRGRAAAAASNNNHNSGGEGYGPGAGYGPGQQSGGGYGAPSSANYGSSSAYDDDGADEDDGPASAMRGRHGGQRNNNFNPSSGAHSGYGRGGGLSQAASHYQQQGSYRNGNQPPVMAAANSAGGGFAGFGYGSGPVDLQGLMAGVSGDPSSGYQVYNGDGSYPGANYYQQQAQRGNRNQQAAAAAASNGYYNNQNQQGSNIRAPKDGSRNENDEHENEGDED